MGTIGRKPSAARAEHLTHVLPSDKFALARERASPPAFTREVRAREGHLSPLLFLSLSFSLFLFFLHLSSLAAVLAASGDNDNTAAVAGAVFETRSISHLVPLRPRVPVDGETESGKYHVGKVPTLIARGSRCPVYPEEATSPVRDYVLPLSQRSV